MKTNKTSSEEQKWKDKLNVTPVISAVVNINGEVEVFQASRRQLIMHSNGNFFPSILASQESNFSYLILKGTTAISKLFFITLYYHSMIQILSYIKMFGSKFQYATQWSNKYK